MPRLTLVMERTPIQVYELGLPVIQIGRELGMEIVIDNVSVSRQQAEIRQDGRYWTVRDLGSTNGTFLNGKPLTEPERLQAGDEISFGKFSLFFEKLFDGPVAGVNIAPAIGKAQAPGTYALGADDLARLQEAIAARRRPQLEWEWGRMRGLHYITTDQVRIGPGKDCQLRIAAMPRKGLLVSRGADGYEVRNLAGWLDFARMKVNGRVMKQARLRTGDVIQIGEVRLTFGDRI
jgi:predicted component of type VI protein secretion system